MSIGFAHALRPGRHPSVTAGPIFLANTTPAAPSTNSLGLQNGTDEIGLQNGTDALGLQG